MGKWRPITLLVTWQREGRAGTQPSPATAIRRMVYVAFFVSLGGLSPCPFEQEPGLLSSTVSPAPSQAVGNTAGDKSKKVQATWESEIRRIKEI
jgi:hypothetical protein